MSPVKRWTPEDNLLIFLGPNRWGQRTPGVGTISPMFPHKNEVRMAGEDRGKAVVNTVCAETHGSKHCTLEVAAEGAASRRDTRRAARGSRLYVSDLLSISGQPVNNRSMFVSSAHMSWHTNCDKT